jgi:hypothetical protein
MGFSRPSVTGNDFKWGAEINPLIISKRQFFVAFRGFGILVVSTMSVVDKRNGPHLSTGREGRLWGQGLVGYVLHCRTDLIPDRVDQPGAGRGRPCLGRKNLALRTPRIVPLQYTSSPTNDMTFISCISA